MSPRLVVTSGPDKGRTLPLKVGKSTLVGRSPATALPLADPQVARVHLEVEWVEAQPKVCNCTNAGMLVNGEPVNEHLLEPGDVIRLGSTELRYLVARPKGSPTETMPALQTQPVETPPPTSALKKKSVAEQPLALLGKNIHHFVLDAIIGKGLTGTVYKAHDDRNNQPVAVKVLRSELAEDDEGVQRFVESMKRMFPIRHPNLVSILGAGRTGTVPWIAMQYVEGNSLAQVIQKAGVGGSLDWKMAFRIAVQVGRGLDHAHSQGLVHRNITPANILVRSADRGALLSDVMLAQAVERNLSNGSKPVKRIADVVYMAPERTDGTTDVDARADLYSLGATMYLMMTGRAPFSGGALTEVVRRIRSAEPERPRKYNLSMPEALDGLIIKVLSKRPEERYQTARDLLVDLERIGRVGGVIVQ